MNAALALAPSLPAPRAQVPRRPALSDRGKFLLFLVMAFGMFMSLLDVQVVAASLSELQAGLSASQDEATWIQTAYLIAEIVMIPLSGFLSRAFSTRWLFATSAALFTIASVVCGFAPSIGVMIVARSVQGFVGGAMVPTAFAAGYALFEGPKRALIPAILGIVATLAPTAGPTLGGWITETFSWHWLFFINVVPGVLITILVPLYGRIDDPDLSVLDGFDVAAVPLLAFFLGGLEYVLEEGPRWDWFDDETNRVVAVVSAVSAVLFLYRSLTHAKPIVNLSLFRERRFALGCLFQFVLGAGMFSSIYLIPQFLAQVQGFRALEIGKAVFITGVFQLLATPLVAFISQRVDPRLLLAFGFTAFAAGVGFMVPITDEWQSGELFWPQALRGFAAMFCIVPASNLALGAMPPGRLKEASALSNLMRNLGGAIGIAAANTILTDRFKMHVEHLSAHVSGGDPALTGPLAHITQRMMEVTGDSVRSSLMAIRLLNTIVQREALTMTFSDAFWLLAALLLAVLTAIPFVGKIQLARGRAAPPAH